MSEPSAHRPVFVVHSLAHAVAALEAANAASREIVLLSALDAGIYAGPGWWRALVDIAREAAPDAQAEFILDCGDDAGAAQGAIRAGVEAIVFAGRAEITERLTAIAAAAGSCLLAQRPGATLDLGSWFFADSGELRRRCADALAKARD